VTAGPFASVAFLPALPLAVSVPLQHVVLLSVALFAVGLVGVTSRRSVLMMLLSVEIMLNAANLALVAFSRVHATMDGQVFVFFAMTVAAAEVAVGLAIVIAVYRVRRTTDVAELVDLREEDYGPPPPLRLEGEDAHAAHDGHEGRDGPGEGGGSGGGDDHGAGVRPALARGGSGAPA
jgi:NADH-quinone oxidoreductase subunit K